MRRVDAGVNAWANKGIEFDANGVAQPVDIGGGSGITQLTGDVTAGPGSGSEAATIANDAVTYAKMQNISTASKLLGRGDSGSGDPQEITLGTNLTMSGTTLNAASGGSPNVGATVVDFGSFPGKSDTSVAITGQTGILSGSKVSAWIVATDTASHSADEHWIETVQVIPGNIVPGTGFTIYAKNTNQLNEPGPIKLDQRSQFAAGLKGGPGRSSENPTAKPKGTRLYGTFTVHWQWV